MSERPVVIPSGGAPQSLSARNDKAFLFYLSALSNDSSAIASIGTARPTARLNRNQAAPRFAPTRPPSPRPTNDIICLSLDCFIFIKARF